jgi:hypothetical protein
LLLAILAVAASALVQVFTDPRVTRRFVARTMIALAVYAAHVAIGVSVVTFLLPHGPQAAVGATAASLGWIGLGALGLLRFAPRLREPPAVLMRFGIADAVCLLAIAGGVLWALGAVA